MGRKIFQNGVWYHIEKKIEYDTEYMARELIELCPQAPVELLQELRWLYRHQELGAYLCGRGHRKGRSGRICCASSKRTATPPTWRWQRTPRCWKTKIAREKTRDNTAKTTD